RQRLERELEAFTESLPTRNGDGVKRPASDDVVHESIGHLERRLTENQKQALMLQQPALKLEQATDVLGAWEQVLGSRPVVDQGGYIRLAVQRVDYDGRQGKLALTLDPVGLVAVLEEQRSLAKEVAK